MKSTGIASIGVAAAFALLLSTCSSQPMPEGNSEFRAREAIFVSTGLHNSVNIYPLRTTGDVMPSAMIRGGATGLDDAKRIAVDSSGNMYVLNDHGGPEYTGMVEVFAPGSRGNVTPIARIAGADTGLRSVNDIAVDSRGNIYVAIEGISVGNVPPGILVFSSGSNGNVKPSANISGPDTAIRNPYGVAVDSKGNVFVAEAPTLDMGRVLVFLAGSKGNVKPKFVIEGSDTSLYAPSAIALDSECNLYVANNEGRNRGHGGSITIFKLDWNGRPDAAAVSSQTAKLADAIIGPRTGLMNDSYASITGITVDSSKNIYLTLQGGQYNEINKVLVFATGSNGDAAPSAVISGHHTMLPHPSGIAIGPYPGTS